MKSETTTYVINALHKHMQAHGITEIAVALDSCTTLGDWVCNMDYGFETALRLGIDINDFSEHYLQYLFAASFTILLNN